MNMGKRIKEVYRKIKEGIKGRFEKKCRWNWPELDTYCGCCNLSTGIYIRTGINLLVTAIIIACNGMILSSIVGISSDQFSANLTTNEHYLANERSNPQEELSQLHIIYMAIVAYYLLWICYKIFYVSLLVLTIFAMLKNNRKMMKILLYISVPNWILDIFISFLAGLIIRLFFKILLVLCILSEGYNILALNSQYKRMVGKSKVRHKDIESETWTPSIPHGDLRFGNDEAHCSGCQCFTSEPRDNENDVVTSQPSADPIQTTLNINKVINENELNYAITGILTPINNEENEAVQSASVQSPIQRPNTLDLTLATVKDEKIVITDEPIIYDVNQLNVGTSPVIEDRGMESRNERD